MSRDRCLTFTVYQQTQRSPVELLSGWNRPLPLLNPREAYWTWTLWLYSHLRTWRKPVSMTPLMNCCWTTKVLFGSHQRNESLLRKSGQTLRWLELKFPLESFIFHMAEDNQNFISGFFLFYFRFFLLFFPVLAVKQLLNSTFSFCSVSIFQGVHICDAWNFLAAAISCKPQSGTGAGVSEVISSTHTRICTRVQLVARPGVSDYSLYLRHISRQRLSKSVHSGWHSTPSQAF